MLSAEFSEEIGTSSSLQVFFGGDSCAFQGLLFLLGIIEDCFLVNIRFLRQVLLAR